MENLTVDLVNIKSVNGTEGEVDIAEKIEKRLREFPYFKNNPDQVWTKTVDNDPLQRKSVFALVKGKHYRAETILLHAHTDTVTIDDFGDLKNVATKPRSEEHTSE